MNNINNVVTLVLLLAVGVLSFFLWKSKEEIKTIKTVRTTDTTYTHKIDSLQRVIKSHGKIDTVKLVRYVTKKTEAGKDTVVTDVENIAKASLDTLINVKDSIISFDLKLGVDYLFPPANEFTIRTNLKYDSKQMRIKDSVYVEKMVKSRWDRFWVGSVATTIVLGATGYGTYKLFK